MVQLINTYTKAKEDEMLEKMLNLVGVIIITIATLALSYYFAKINLMINMQMKALTQYKLLILSQKILTQKQQDFTMNIIMEVIYYIEEFQYLQTQGQIYMHQNLAKKRKNIFLRFYRYFKHWKVLWRYIKNMI